jgi:hypothetical protein
MQEHALGVGDELVIDDHIRLTLLAVEAGEALLAVTDSDTNDGGDAEANQLRSGLTVRLISLPTET